jgi:hypothetical protein
LNLEVIRFFGVGEKSPYATPVVFDGKITIKDRY